MKKLFFAYSWLLLTVGVMLTSVAAYNFYLIPHKLVKAPEGKDEQHILGAAQKPGANRTHDQLSVKNIVEADDARAEIVAHFLSRYKSPLKPYSYYGRVFVEIADKNNFDFRLLPAIAMKESNLCKKIPEDSFNCLGFGIHEKGTLKFKSYEANFERAGRELKLYYIDEGLTTPREIASKYLSGDKDLWADTVNQFMTEMRYNDRELGIELDHNNNVLEYTREK